MEFLSYTAKELALQRRFDTERLAAIELQAVARDKLDRNDYGLIERSEFFWLSSVDLDGSPTVSFKGGIPGFVHILNDQTLLFPSFDVNGMFPSMGDLASTSKIGMLFTCFETSNCLRIQGTTQITEDPVILGRWPGAQLGIQVAITALFPNCTHYLPRMQQVEASRYVPHSRTGN